MSPVPEYLYKLIPAQGTFSYEVMSMSILVSCTSYCSIIIFYQEPSLVLQLSCAKNYPYTALLHHAWSASPLAWPRKQLYGQSEGYSTPFFSYSRLLLLNTMRASSDLQACLREVATGRISSRALTYEYLHLCPTVHSEQ